MLVPLYIPFASIIYIRDELFNFILFLGETGQIQNMLKSLLLVGTVFVSVPLSLKENLSLELVDTVFVSLIYHVLLLNESSASFFN